MNTQKQEIFLILLLTILTSCSQKQSMQWIPFSWKSDTISGKYVEKAYMYIPVKIEDLPYDFTMQFDLGTYTSLLYGNAVDPYLKKSTSLINKLDSTRIWARNVSLQLGTIKLDSIDLGYKNNFGEKIPEDSLHTKTPKHIGTIAPDMFKNKILIIDYKATKFAVADQLPPEYKDLPAEKIELEDGITKLPFRINGKVCKLMFDTGSSPFQLVTTKERALEIADPTVIDSLGGPLWWGQEITFYGFNVNKPIEFGGKTAANSTVYYDKEGLWNDVYKSFNVWGITGNAYFYDCVVIIDYKNQLFRVKY